MDEDGFCSAICGQIQSKGDCGWYVRASHLALERRLETSATSRVLKVGGSLDEHVPFDSHAYSEFVLTDHRHIDYTTLNGKARFEIADVESLPYEDHSYDRVILTCVFHHLDQPRRPFKRLEELFGRVG